MQTAPPPPTSCTAAALGRALWAEEYGTPYGYTAINLKLKANASYATQKSIAGLVTRRGGVLRTNSYETARRMYQEGSTGAFFWAVAGVVGAALALFLLWNLFGLYWQHQRLRIGIFQAEGTSAAMLRHCGIRQGVLAVLGALLLATWPYGACGAGAGTAGHPAERPHPDLCGPCLWPYRSIPRRCTLRYAQVICCSCWRCSWPPLERLARSQPMDNLKKGV